ncbi:5-formyltetrahydrofolate cyclo-ligase [Chitinophaga tropicalis]|uniref:5-formyltetrahydrofolate cyclo-ligase n=1 Tax=Chitinophaga tropicalis TaxID=2683588 RepID=A0A7K1U135_9BACT|nr:5-formyltetrahydrofolate cyclo-ligase [Chitinophaga tropicalis]MVT08063.1 5-formyltetrahydrofolate cyclo-ligase [Chitinophaga tropicalis]
MLTKKDIRKEYLEKRLNLPDNVITTLNRQLLEQCRQLDYSTFRLAHIFLPITEKKEADTHALVNWARTAYPSLQWALSRSDMHNGDMEHYLWEPNTVLMKNGYGIPEPAGGKQVMPAEMDLVFVPLLAFDLQGHRVGYGKGMYDRFLKQCRPGVTTIGLSLFDPVTAIEDTGHLDVPLRIAITPHSIYYFKKS